jgi:hypothetical protein
MSSIMIGSSSDDTFLFVMRNKEVYVDLYLKAVSLNVDSVASGSIYKYKSV